MQRFEELLLLFQCLCLVCTFPPSNWTTTLFKEGDQLWTGQFSNCMHCHNTKSLATTLLTIHHCSNTGSISNCPNAQGSFTGKDQIQKTACWLNYKCNEIVRCSGMFVMVQNNQESRCKYWATRLSVCSFALHRLLCLRTLVRQLLTSLTPSLVGQ